MIITPKSHTIEMSDDVYVGEIEYSYIEAGIYDLGNFRRGLEAEGLDKWRRENKPQVEHEEARK